MIDQRSVPGTASDLVRDEHSMKLFEYLVSTLALLAAVLLALMR